MKQIETRLTYKVPSWNYCNLDSVLTNMSATCRFCVKQGKMYICTMHDTVLAADTMLISKCAKCIKITTTGKDTEPDLPQPDPRQLITSTIDAYEKQLTALMNAGYPRDLAASVAKKYLTGEK